MFDHANVRYAIGLLLKSLGQEDLNREGLLETPERVTKAWEFWTNGYNQDISAILKEFKDGGEEYDELIFQGNIPFFSICEHHLVPFFGVAHIGYIPSGKIVGLSKLARLVEAFSRRLQVQERITQQIAEAMDEYLLPIGIGVVLRCRHLCIESRGIQKHGTTTTTSALFGCIKEEDSSRAEFLQFVQTADLGAKTF